MDLCMLSSLCKFGSFIRRFPLLVIMFVMSYLVLLIGLL